MRGNAPALRDLNIVLEDHVLPVNLLSDEVLDSDDEEAEVEPSSPYKVDTYCNICEVAVRLYVTATAAAIRQFEQLLLSSLNILCAECARNRRHGRTQ